MKNRDYTVDELVHNPSFRRMIKGTANSDDVKKWNSWIEESDQNRAKVKLAFSKIAGFEFDDPASLDIEKAWFRLHGDTVAKQYLPHLGTAEKDSSLQWIYRIAATFLIISMVGVGSYLYSKKDQAPSHSGQTTKEKTIATERNEKKSLIFSNGSKIILNSNSMLTYTVGLLHDETVRVSLQGEAYFDADSKSLKDQPAFSVTTPAGIIEDIGTEFLVSVKKERSRIVLQEGRVKVEAGNGKILPEVFHVNEGEMIEFSKTDIQKKEKVNPTFYTSWATGSMTFNQTRIREFAEYLEKRFDIEVQVADSSLTEIKIDGAIYFKSLEGLVRSVSDVIKIPTYQSEDRNTVYIGNRE